MKYLSLCAGFCALFMFVPVSVSAETHVVPGPDGFYHGGVWNEVGNPYILDDYINVANDSSLFIGPGVSVMAASSSDYSLSGDDHIVIAGTPESPVQFYGLGTMYFGTSTVSNAELYDTGIKFNGGSSTLSRISFYGADTAIAAVGSTITADHLLFASSTYGIYSLHTPGPVFQVMNETRKRFGFAFNLVNVAHAQTAPADDPKENHIIIHDSSFEGAQYAIHNDISNVIHAENNWWGSDTGPFTIYGPVSYAPWTTHAVAATCCSSVFFVPGIESSRLMQDNRRVLGTTVSQLWEPFLDSSVQSLYLDASGASIKANIRPGGVIDTALGMKPIYQKFIDTMNGLVKSGTIADWRSFPYDWRLPLSVEAKGLVGTSTAVQAIEAMASSSKTGKVTIIAHSNGGLVTKLLYDQLRAKGEAGLVDKVIFVAVPETGTPQAFASLLHGDNEEIANGIVLSAPTARTLGINMPSAYSLLPDQDYFAEAPRSIAIFASTTLAGMDFSKYFPAITSYSAMKSFITDSSHGSLSAPTNIPVVGNARLLPPAESVHSILDGWKPASSTQLIAIAGWGMPTNVGVSYFEKIVCSAAGFLHIGSVSCSPNLEYSDVTSNAGDGTVAIDSALYSSSTQKIFDEGAYDRDAGKSLAHGDILEADPVETAIKSAIGAASSSASIPYIYDSIPDIRLPDDFVVEVHSPADINVYDAVGRHTGPIPNPIAGSDLDMYENKIPGSVYRETGDGQQVILPYRQDYSIDLDGTGFGGITVTTERTTGNDMAVVASSSFQGIVVTPLSHMEFIMATGTSKTDPYKAIKIDENGDGVFDATSTPDSMPSISLDAYKQSLADCIRSLKLNKNDEKSFLGRLDKAWKLIQSDRSGRTDKAWRDMAETRMRHIDSQRTSDPDRSRMRAVIGGLFGDLGV